jgi:hypothetical protein
VADVPGLGPTVYMGSYNGDFYAFNAQSGALRWVHRDARDNRISGSATIVNGVVYYSDLDDKLTTGLDARTGRVRFSFNDGAFSPVVADPSHIYLSGGYALYELLPQDRLRAARPSPAHLRHRSRRQARSTVKGPRHRRRTSGATRSGRPRRPSRG